MTGSSRSPLACVGSYTLMYTQHSIQYVLHRATLSSQELTPSFNCTVKIRGGRACMCQVLNQCFEWMYSPLLWGVVKESGVSIIAVVFSWILKCVRYDNVPAYISQHRSGSTWKQIFPHISAPRRHAGPGFLCPVILPPPGSSTSSVQTVWEDVKDWSCTYNPNTVSLARTHFNDFS